MAAKVGASPPGLPNDYKPIFQRLEELFSSGQYSDLRITCRDFGWNVHRNIVCSASDFFEKCCLNFKEAQTGIIDLPDDNPFTINALLRYLYTADYVDDTPVADAAPILFNVHVHTIADKYNVPGLCRLAEAKFAKRAGAEWNTEGFVEAVREMYATSPESKKAMQESAVSIAVKHAQDLFRDDQSSFQKMAQTVASFACGVSSQLMAAHLERDQLESRGFRHCQKCRVMVKPRVEDYTGFGHGKPPDRCPKCESAFR